MSDDINETASAARGDWRPPSNVAPITVGSEPFRDRRPVFLAGFGRGNTGKSTGLLWMGERAIGAGRVVAVGDCDRNNQTLTAFVGTRVERPDQPDDDSVVTWLNEAVDVSVSTKASMVLDMG